MNKRFPVLSAVATILRIVGWLAVVLGLAFAVYGGVIEPSRPGHSFGGEDIVELVLGSGVCLLGLLTVAFSELIGVLFAIEENTRKEKKE